MSVRSRIALFAAVAVFLALVASGASALPAAVSLWTSSAQVASTATAATVGITQSLPSTPDLVHTYSTTALTAGSPVTLTNSGNRDSTWTLSVAVTSSTSAAYQAAVAIKAAVVATAAACSGTATLTSPATGTLASTFSTTGSFAAGASVIVCVQTSMASGDATTYAQKTMTLGISSTSTVSTWSTSSTSASVVQNVAASLLFFTNNSGRYTISIGGGCLSMYGGTPTVVKGGACSDTNSQWRLTADAGGNFYITLAATYATAHTDWSLSSSTSYIGVVAEALTAPMRWKVQAHPDGTSFQLVNEQYGTCAYASTVGYDNASSAPFKLAAAPCSSSATQAITFTTIGTPVPTTPATATCTGNNLNYISYSWPIATGYQGEITYKVYVGGVFVTDYTNGYSTTVNLYTDQTPTVPVATIGAGTKVVEIKQSIAGSAYTTSATGSMYIGVNPNVIKCTQ